MTYEELCTKLDGILLTVGYAPMKPGGNDVFGRAETVTGGDILRAIVDEISRRMEGSNANGS